MEYRYDHECRCWSLDLQLKSPAKVSILGATTQGRLLAIVTLGEAKSLRTFSGFIGGCQSLPLGRFGGQNPDAKQPSFFTVEVLLSLSF